MVVVWGGVMLIRWTKKDETSAMLGSWCAITQERGAECEPSNVDEAMLMLWDDKYVTFVRWLAKKKSATIHAFNFGTVANAAASREGLLGLRPGCWHHAALEW